MNSIVAKTRNNFAYVSPTAINFGVGVSAGTAEQAKSLGISKAMVVTDTFLSETQGGKAVIEGLRNAGCNPIVWPGVVPDPTDTSIHEGAEVYLKAECDSLIAIGGGSHMDTAKCIGVLVMNGNKISDYYTCIENPNPAPITRVPPLICLPTTAGTGAEVTNAAVVSATSDNRKFGVVHPLIAPRMALVDPGLTLTLPPLQTAATGLDALAHAVEGYISILENPITDALALYSLELISNNLRRAVYSGADMEARINMSLAALLAGLVIGTCYATSGHAVGQAIGGRFHILHGLSVSLPLPAALEYNRPACQEKLSKIAFVMGAAKEGMSQREAADAAIEEIVQLIKDVNVPTLAESATMSDEDIDMVACAAAADGCSFLNPRPWSAQTYVGLLKKTLGTA
jgi:alcohol dehydrogenase class IV